MIRSKSGFAHLLDRDLAAITAWDIEKWRAERLKSGMKPATCNRVINALRGAFSRAAEWEIIEDHPMKIVKRQREPEPDGDRYLLPDEEARLRAALDAYDEAVREEQRNVARRLRRIESSRTYGDATKPAVLLALNLACRRGELLKLEWRHVDLDGARVPFPGINTKNTKARVLPLNREALAVLTAWRAQCPAEAMYVFPGERSNIPLRELKAWPKVRDAANITRLRLRLRLRLRFHDARHHAASRLTMAGIDIHSVSKVLGHRDVRMVSRYAHLSPERLLRTVSIGFMPTQWRAREGGKGGMVFTQFEILELSVVAVPANSGAVIETVAEAAGLSNLKRALRDEPTWMAEMLAPAMPPNGSRIRPARSWASCA